MLTLIKDMYHRYLEDEVAAYAAEMAYYFLLSVFPFLIFLTTVIGYLPVTGENLLDSMVDILPYESYVIVRKNVEQVIRNRNLSLLSFGFVSMLWAASSGIRAVMRGINKALCQKDTRPFWIAIPLSLLFTVLAAVVVILYFMLLIFGRQIGAWLLRIGLSQLYWKGWQLLRYTIAITMMVLFFLLLYRYSPCIRVSWRDAIPGAAFATAGWLLVSWLFAWYTNHFWNLSLLYGSIGGIIGLLVWLFISAQLIILGGELNALLLSRRQSIRKKKAPDSPRL